MKNLFSMFASFFLLLFCLTFVNVSYARETVNVEKQEITYDISNYNCSVCGDCFVWSDNFEKNHPLPQYNQCIASSKGTYDTVQCLDEEIDRQDIILNKKYKKLMMSLPKKQRVALRNYQREWIKDRDSKFECASGATLGRQNEMNFLLTFTLRRIDEFEQCLSAKKINRNSKGCENLYPLK